MIPQETVQKILDTAKIEEVIGDFVTLKRRGAEYWACCPFHNEKARLSTSFPPKACTTVSAATKGSAVGFVMDYEHLSYAEALRYLAKKYNIEVIERRRPLKTSRTENATGELDAGLGICRKVLSGATENG